MIKKKKWSNSMLLVPGCNFCDLCCSAGVNAVRHKILRYFSPGYLKTCRCSMAWMAL
jgi:hypothetical protein